MEATSPHGMNPRDCAATNTPTGTEGHSVPAVASYSSNHPAPPRHNYNHPEEFGYNTSRAVQDAASKRRHTTDVCVTNPNNEGPSPSNTHRVSSSPLLQRRRATFSPPAHTPAAAFPASTPNLVGHGIVSLLDARMAENQLSLIREEENEALAIMLGAQQAARWVTDADIDRVNLAFDAFKQAVKKTHTATKNFLAVATAALEHSQSGIALAQADAGDVSNARVAELREILARATHMMDVMVRFMANGSKTPYYVPQPPPV